MKLIAVAGISIGCTLVAACQPSYRAANPAFYQGVNQSSVGGTAMCRSGLTGDVYTVHGAGCSSGDTPVSTTDMTSTPQSIPSPGPRRDSAAACEDVAIAGASRPVKLDALLAALRPIARPKGEFETTNEYNSKVASAVKRIGSTNYDQSDSGRLVFSFPISSSFIKYDADSQYLTIGSTVTEYMGIIPSKWAVGVDNYVPVTSKRVGASTYIGSNAFGVKKEVLKIGTVDTGVSIPGGSQSGWPFTFKAVRRQMTAQEAITAKSGLSVVIVGSLKEPYIVNGVSYRTATINSPIEEATKVEAVKLSPECAIIYDKTSKTSFGSVSFKKG